MLRLRTLRSAAPHHAGGMRRWVAVSVLWTLPLAVQAADAPAGAGDAAKHPASCAGTACQAGAATAAADALTDAEVQKIVDYILKRARETDGPLSISPVELATATGVRIRGRSQEVLQRIVEKLDTTEEGRVLAEKIRAANAACASGSACAPGASASRCTEYGACSLDGDLSGATGEELDLYVREKAHDGQRFEDRALPDFVAEDLNGDPVHAAQLEGRPVLLVTLAEHCGHCWETLPMLQALERQYAPRGVRIVGVYVNSGTASEVRKWLVEEKPRWEVWVSDTNQLGDALDSHLVPTYFLVDAAGNLRHKLVGFKEASAVQSALEDLLGDAASPEKTAVASGEEED